MLRDILVTILRPEPDFEVVSGSVETVSLIQAVNETSPDVLVTSLREPDVLAMAGDLLLAHPALMLFVVTGDGRSAFEYKLRPQRVPLGEPSPETLLAAVRWARQERVAQKAGKPC